jgi:hypothetical protein
LLGGREVEEKEKKGSVVAVKLAGALSIFSPVRASLQHSSPGSSSFTMADEQSSSLAFQDDFTKSHGGACFFVSVDPVFDEQVNAFCLACCWNTRSPLARVYRSSKRLL